MNDSDNLLFPAAFAQVVADAVPHMLKRQRADGAIIYDEAAPIVFPQQAIFPLAFCYAGLDPDKRHKGSREVHDGIERLTKFLVRQFDDTGQFHWESFGNKIVGVDQRLTYAWLEGLHILREAGADFDFAPWEDKIIRACENLISHRLKSLLGLRRFIRLSTGTGLNHVALYISTVYRAGQILKRPDFRDIALKLGRALAADVHPDGYWEEHSDLLSNGGPTPLYNYLSHNAMALMYAWTGEDCFRAAIERSTRFHNNFCYPDASPCEIIDERVRYHHEPMVWGLFGFSHSAEGRGSAIEHFKAWVAHNTPEKMSPESLARQCENFMYWQAGDAAMPPFAKKDHTATLTMPAGIFRRGAWSIGLATARAYNPEDGANRGNPFALDRQKVFSVWHEKTGMLLDGAHSKNQPDNSTFSAKYWDVQDFYPMGGRIAEENGELVAHAIYKSFYGTVRVRPISDGELRIELSIDPAGCSVPVRAGFTLHRKGDEASSLSGKQLPLNADPFELSRDELGGGFRYGNAVIESAADFKLHWPLMPFNSYAADNKHKPAAYQLRVSVMLTAELRKAEFTVRIKD